MIKVLLKVFFLQNSQESACVGVSFLIELHAFSRSLLLQKRSILEVLQGSHYASDRLAESLF